MRLLIASQNEVKRLAAEDAFAEFYPNCDIQVDMPERPISSDISEQPLLMQQAMKGVENRLANARALIPGKFAAYVAIEGGCYRIGGNWFHAEFAGVMKNRRIFHAHSPGFPIPESFSELLDKGATLGQAMEKRTGISDAGKKEGFTGWLAGTAYNRRNTSKMAVYLALCGMDNADL